MNGFVSSRKLTRMKLREHRFVVVYSIKKKRKKKKQWKVCRGNDIPNHQEDKSIRRAVCINKETNLAGSSILGTHSTSNTARRSSSPRERRFVTTLFKVQRPVGLFWSIPVYGLLLEAKRLHTWYSSANEQRIEGSSSNKELSPSNTKQTRQNASHETKLL